MLYTGYLQWHVCRTDVVLLNGVVPPECEQRGGGTVAGDSSDTLNDWDDLIGDLFCSYVPGASLAVSQISMMSTSELGLIACRIPTLRSIVLCAHSSTMRTSWGQLRGSLTYQVL